MLATESGIGRTCTSMQTLPFLPFNRTARAINTDDVRVHVCVVYHHS